MSIISTTVLTPNPGPHPGDRRCSDPTCITILCRYDPGPLCFAHQQERERQDREDFYRHLMTELPQAA